MEDTYMAVYNAVSQKIHNTDVGQAVTEALRNTIYNVDIGQAVENAVREVVTQIFSPIERASVLMRPQLSIDGNQWMALYGENTQDGVAGFGDSPEEAMSDFDRNWSKRLAG